ncbi:MAG: hypothetical protein ACFFC1_20440 [Promethearchaeota archaeon]
MNEAMELINKLGIKVKRSDMLNKRELGEWLGESVLDPIREKLASDVWTTDEEHIKPKHRKFILDNLEKWLNKMDVNQEPSKISIIGSITTFQYSDSADIDVNVVLDLTDSQFEELKKLLPNGKNLPGTKHPVNYYVDKKALENIKKRNSIYDLKNDRWEKKPEKKDVKIPYAYVMEIAKFFMAGIDNRVGEYERDKHELELYKSYLEDATVKIDSDELQAAISLKESEILADLDSLYVALKMVKGFRGKAYEKDYEPDFLISIDIKDSDFSVNNLVYKTLERFGYLDKLHKYKEIRDKYKEK